MIILDQFRAKNLPLRVLSAGVLAGLLMLLIGLWNVQVVTAKRYKASQVSQSFRTVRTPAIRGQIHDINGLALADNRPSYDINLYLEELRPYFQKAYAQAKRGKRLTLPQRLALGREVRYLVVSNLVMSVTRHLEKPHELDPLQFRRHYNERLALPMPVLSDISDKQVALFMERAAHLPGCDLEARPIRIYPHDTLAAHVLGYLRRDDRYDEEGGPYHYRLPDYSGIIGIERTRDDELRGTPGIKSVLVNSLGYRQSESVWAPPDPGYTVVLTIDAALQKAAEEALQSASPETRGAAIIMDVRSGDLLAVASNPSFNPNEFLPRLSSRDWASMNDPELKPLLNRATYGIYAPGSVFKMIIGLAGLESGMLKPNDLYSSPGYYQLGRRRIKDTANGGRPAKFDFKTALAQSSNAYFIHYGLLIGQKKIVELGKRFHLGEPTGIPTGQDHKGIFPTEAWQQKHLKGKWYDGDTANLSIGQGYIAVTPLQVAVMTAAIANGGKVLKPRLVDRIEPPHGVEGPTSILPSPMVRDDLGVSTWSLKVIHDAMRADVEDPIGTGRNAFVEGMGICGKTGTAQVQQGSRIVDHITWFVSFAPYEKPKYAVVVMVESGVSGGYSCAPIARLIYEALQARDQTRPPKALNLALQRGQP